jgi:hypothetical protein
MRRKKRSPDHPLTRRRAIDEEGYTDFRPKLKSDKSFRQTKPVPPRSISTFELENLVMAFAMHLHDKGKLESFWSKVDFKGLHIPETLAKDLVLRKLKENHEQSKYDELLKRLNLSEEDLALLKQNL